MAAPFLLISDFNVEILARFIRKQVDGRAVDVADFNMVFQTLAEAQDVCGVLWTQPQAVIPTFRRAMQCEPVDDEQCLREVEEFAGFILRFADVNPYCFVVSWAMPPDHRGYGMLDWRPGLGLSHLLARMNVRLADCLSMRPNLCLLDGERVLRRGGSGPGKLWYAAKIPFANSVFEGLADDLVAAQKALAGQSRRMLVLDLDHTLWGGVVGETGWQGLKLGGHDHVGEAYRDFQLAVKALSNRGIQLAIASKNDESVALEAIAKHPEMVLRESDFVIWRIDWHDKAANIAAMAEEINLGLGSLVFIDDNPVERDRVRQALPDVHVPEWPVDPANYVHALNALNCFDSASLSEEDRQRTKMYRADRQRRDTRELAASTGDWLGQLETVATVDVVSKDNVVRVAQLFNKTNQLNMATRRMTEAEILKWSEKEGHFLLALSVSDRFGSVGLVGLIGVAVEGNMATLTDYLLSCRVMGRGVERLMIFLAADLAREKGATSLTACYLATERNGPTLRVLRECGLREAEMGVFQLDLSQTYAPPDGIRIDNRTAL